MHSGSKSGGDAFERVTTIIYNKSGARLYFYRKSDKTFWDRVHVPSSATANSHVWQKTDDYSPITKAQFDA